MRVLTVRFKSVASRDELAAPFMELAPLVAAVPGLLSKIWINDGDYFGGVYVFRDQSSLDTYLAGSIVAQVMSNPAFSDFRVEQYEVLGQPTAVTRGSVAVAT